MQKHGRMWIGAIIAMVALVPMGIAFGASRAGSVNGSRASCLNWKARNTSTTTHSTRWVNIPGMRLNALLAENFAVQVSGTFSGDVVQIRALDTSVGGAFPLAPRSTTIVWLAGPRDFSFTWVGTSPAEHEHTIQLQWRLPSTGIITMDAGAMTLLYEGAPTPSRC